jgi:hypothetical protein
VEDALLEAEVDARVVEPLAVEPVSDADGVHHVDRVLLEQPRADALLDVLAAAGLEHDALDPRLVQEERECQPGRPCPDDAHLGLHPEGDPISCTHAVQAFA